MKTFNIFALAAILAVFSVAGNAQTTTYSTTITSALSAPSANVVNGSVDTVYVASTTNMLSSQISNNPGSAQTWLLIDKELMPVVLVLSSTSVQVLRGAGSGGQGGSTPANHISSSVVWFGPYNVFLTGTSGDPSGACVATNYQFLPLINVGNGHIMYCDMVTATNGVWARSGDYFFVNPVGCGSLATTTATTDNGMVPAATGNVVHQFTTNTTGGTTQLTCPFNVPSELLNSAKGMIVTDVALLYGVQTTAISSIATATVKSVTYPISTAAGAAAAGTVAAAGGTITATPTVLQKATTTTGQCYSEDLSFGTPVWINTDATSFSVDQVFTNSAAATVYQVCGLLVHYHTAT